MKFPAAFIFIVIGALNLARVIKCSSDYSLVQELALRKFSDWALVFVGHSDGILETTLSGIVSDGQTKIVLTGSNETKIPEARKDIRKHTNYRNLIISLPSPDLVERMNNFDYLKKLSEARIPILKRDMDYLIFLLDSSEQNKIEPTTIYIMEMYLYRYQIMVTPDSGFCNCRQYCQMNQCSDKYIENHEDERAAELFLDPSKDMTGRYLRVVGPTRYYGIFGVERIEGTRFKITRGVFGDIFHLAQHGLNFTYDLNTCDYRHGSKHEDRTGALLPNGTWSGCTADLYYNYADISIGTSAKEVDRYNVIEYMTPHIYHIFELFTHQPYQVYSWEVAFKAFDMVVWGFSLGLMVIAFFGTYYLTENHKYPIPYLLLYIVGNSLGQGISIEPNAFSARTFFGMWLIAAIVMGTAYNSSFQTLVISPGITFVPEDMKELVESHPEWTWGSSKGFSAGIGGQYVSKSQIPRVIKMHKNQLTDLDVSECLYKAATTDYVCIHWSEMAEFVINTEFLIGNGHPFDFHLSRDYAVLFPFSWSTRKREIFANGFNFYSGQCFESGVWMELMAMDARNVRKVLLEEVRLGKRPELKEKELVKKIIEDGPKPFKFDSVKGAFFILLGGVITSSTIFTAEYLMRIMKVIKNSVTLFYMVHRRPVKKKRRREQSNNVVIKKKEPMVVHHQIQLFRDEMNKSSVTRC